MRSEITCGCGHVGKDHTLEFVGTEWFVSCTVCDNTWDCPHGTEGEMIDLLVEYG